MIKNVGSKVDVCTKVSISPANPITNNAVIPNHPNNANIIPITTIVKAKEDMNPIITRS
jgi:hypothetical protein